MCELLAASTLQPTRLTFSLHTPVGQTDSKRAFCALLARLSLLWDNAKVADPPSLQARMALLVGFAADALILGRMRGVVRASG